MVKITRIWCKNVQNNIFKILTPLPSFQGGQKGLKFEKKHVFSTKSISRARTVSCAPLFYDRFRKRNIWAWDSAKKIMGSTSGKKVTVVLKIFFEKKRQFFFGHPKIWQLKTITKHQISPKIFFIVPKSYFRSLKPFRTILGIKNLTRPIDQKFLKNHNFSH